MIAQKDPAIQIHIFEPHPTELGQERTTNFRNIDFIDRLDNDYDCLVCTDVLEHIIDPIHTLYEMIMCVKPGGYLLIANNFYPVIKCHLPSTFHLRYSFNFFARKLGIMRIGKCEGSHAVVYKKINKVLTVNWKLLNIYEKISKIAFPFLLYIHKIWNFYKRL